MSSNLLDACTALFSLVQIPISHTNSSSWYMYIMQVYAMSHKTCSICITKISSVAASHVQSSSASVKRQWRRVGPASKRFDAKHKNDKTSQKIERSYSPYSSNLTPTFTFSHHLLQQPKTGIWKGLYQRSPQSPSCQLLGDRPFPLISPSGHSKYENVHSLRKSTYFWCNSAATPRQNKSLSRVQKIQRVQTFHRWFLLCSSWAQWRSLFCALSFSCSHRTWDHRGCKDHARVATFGFSIVSIVNTINITYSRKNQWTGPFRASDIKVDIKATSKKGPQNHHHAAEETKNRKGYYILTLEQQPNSMKAGRLARSTNIYHESGDG